MVHVLNEMLHVCVFGRMGIEQPDVAAPATLGKHS